MAPDWFDAERYPEVSLLDRARRSRGRPGRVRGRDHDQGRHPARNADRHDRRPGHRSVRQRRATGSSSRRRSTGPRSGSPGTPTCRTARRRSPTRSPSRPTSRWSGRVTMRRPRDLRQPPSRLAQHLLCGPRRSCSSRATSSSSGEGLREIPAVRQDDDVEPAPAAVAALRAAVAAADAVLIATPEYNSSIPGTLKNALDWASRPIATNAFRNKPVAVIGSSIGHVRRRSGRRPSSARCSPRWARGSPRSRSRSAARREFDRDGKLIDDEVREQLRDALATLVAELEPARRRLARALLDPRARAAARPRRAAGAPTERESTPTSRPSVDHRDALEVALFEEARTPRRAASRGRRRSSATRRSRGAASSSGHGRVATTSRTSVLRVITPTSRPPRRHEHRPHLGPRQRLPGLLRGRTASSASGSETIASRTLRLAHGYIPRASSAAGDLADPGDERGACAARRPSRSESVQTRSKASASFVGEPARGSRRGPRRAGSRSCTHSK